MTHDKMSTINPCAQAATAYSDSFASKIWSLHAHDQEVEQRSQGIGVVQDSCAISESLFRREQHCFTQFERWCTKAILVSGEELFS